MKKILGSGIETLTDDFENASSSTRNLDPANLGTSRSKCPTISFTILCVFLHVRSLEV